jgi:2'-5' RNA ligase
MATIRAFIALDLPETAKAELDRVSRELAGDLPRGAVRWVRPEQMHLTLHFLGDAPVDRLPAIQTAMDQAASRQEAFDLILGRLGCFPNPKRPRVIWVGLVTKEGSDSRDLLALKAALDAGLAPLGWLPEDKPFRAHLTLGRVKDESAARGLDWSTAVTPLSVPVAALNLIESDLRPTGPIYTRRYRSALVGEGFGRE